MAINATIPAVLEPLAGVISGIVGMLKPLVGGIFGLYVILVILRLLEYKRMVRLLTQIKEEIAELNKNLTGKKKKR